VKPKFILKVESWKKLSRGNSEFIEISSVTVINNKLEVKLAFSKKMSRYFFKNSFEVFYDKNIENVDESILSIPAVCTTIQIAWAAGADLYVKKLDETCLMRLKKLRKVFATYNPNFLDSGNIFVEKIISNKFNNKQSALLFSGGLDSICSYVRNKDQHPILITMLKGNDTSRLDIENNDLKNLTQKFSEQEEVETHFIRNMLYNRPLGELINSRTLGHDFKVRWWDDIAIGLITLGLVAPISVERIQKILLASTYQKNFRANNAHKGFHFLTDGDFSWADLEVVYDAEFSRQEKIHFLRNAPHYLKNLLVCFHPIQSPNPKNCGFCVKCWRTITGLILEGIDPNECNFHVKNNVLDEVKDMLKKCSFLIESNNLWSDIQKYIPDTINDDEISRRYYAKQFFEWFKDYKFPDYKKGNFFFNYLKYFYYCEKYHGIYFSIKRLLGFIQWILKKRF